MQPVAGRVLCLQTGTSWCSVPQCAQHSTSAAAMSAEQGLIVVSPNISKALEGAEVDVLVCLATQGKSCRCYRLHIDQFVDLDRKAVPYLCSRVA